MDRLVARAEGNPLYIVEILRGAHSRRGDRASTIDPDTQVVRSLASLSSITSARSRRTPAA